MKKSFILLVLWSFGVSLLAQNNERDSWESGRIEEFNIINSLPDVLENDLIFYGFIHGAAMPQEVEAKILKELMTKDSTWEILLATYS